MTMSLDAEDPAPVRPQDPPATPGADGVGTDPGDAAAPVRPPGWAWWLLRVFLTVQAVDVFLQAVLAGRFLSGDFGMLATHRSNGVFAGGWGLAQIVAAALAWRVSRLPGRIAAVVAALGAAIALQIYLGFNRVLGIHIPLGVAIIAVSGGLARWMWTHRPGGQPTGTHW